MDGTISIGVHLTLIQIRYLVRGGTEYRVSACSISVNERDEPFTDVTVIDDRGGAIGPIFPSDHGSSRFSKSTKIERSFAS